MSANKQSPDRDNNANHDQGAPDQSPKRERGNPAQSPRNKQRSVQASHDGRCRYPRTEAPAAPGSVANASGSDGSPKTNTQYVVTKARTPTDKTALQRRIAATDKRIDQLVYELYGLTDDEIRIVEQPTQ